MLSANSGRDASITANFSEVTLYSSELSLSCGTSDPECVSVKVDRLTRPVNTGTAKTVGLGGFGKFGVWCVAR